jgi:intracellular multiplication protein IcmB
MAPELCRLALDLGFNLDSKSSWFELTDFLFSQGYPQKALLAQRLAVPLLNDVAFEVRQHPGIRAAYNFKIENTQESILDFVWRSLAEAASAYRFLTQPTQIGFGEAKVLALDLDETASRGGGAAGDRRTAVMYLLARFLAGSRFFLTQSEISQIPSLYRKYHQIEIERMARDPKRICYDELHRVMGLSSVSNQLIDDLETSARESRKWNLSIGLYSQSWRDFPKVIMELATSIFILGAGTDRGRKELAELFGLSASLEESLSKLGSPQSSGAPLLAIYRSQRGVTKHLLINTLSPRLIWAFSTTSEDMFVRDKLYSLIGVEKTLTILSEMYPKGLKREIERRKQSLAFVSSDETEQKAIDSLIETILSLA